MASLKGKIVLITGAACGIGQATAVYFASLGSKLVISDRNVNGLQETVPKCEGAEDILSVAGDLTVEADVDRIMGRTIEHYKQLDVLVNNAGVFELGSIETSSLEQYDRIMNINLRAVYQLTMLAVPHLISSKGAIVNASSLLGLRSFPGALAYSLSKSALDQFTRCIALELAPKQIRVNTINPGVIPTNIYKSIGFTDEQCTALLERSKNIVPLGRTGGPEEVAKAIAFLASSDASFSTGVQLPVDGGHHVLCPR